MPSAWPTIPPFGKCLSGRASRTPPAKGFSIRSQADTATKIGRRLFPGGCRLQMRVEPVGDLNGVLVHVRPAVFSSWLDHELRFDPGGFQLFDDQFRLLDGDEPVLVSVKNQRRRI